MEPVALNLGENNGLTSPLLVFFELLDLHRGRRLGLRLSM